jgi:hypothetical protein
LVLLPGLVVILGAVMGGFVLAGQRFKQVEHHVFFSVEGEKEKKKTKGKSFTCQVTHTPARRPNKTCTTVAATSLSLSL